MPAALALVTRPALAAHGAGGSTPRITRVCPSSGSARSPTARRTFDDVLDRKPPGYVAIAAALASGEAAEAAGDFAAAVRIYERIADAEGRRHRRRAVAARPRGARGRRPGEGRRGLRARLLRVPADRAARRWPGSSSTGCRTRSSAPATSSISAARRSCSARGATPRRARRSQDLQRVAEGDDKELVDLRIAECDFH